MTTPSSPLPDPLESGADPPPDIARRLLALGLRSAPRPAEAVAARLAGADGPAWFTGAIKDTLGIDERALLHGAPTGAELADWLDRCRALADDDDPSRRLAAAAAYFAVTCCALARGEDARNATAAADLELALEELEPVAPEAWRPLLGAALRRLRG